MPEWAEATGEVDVYSPKTGEHLRREERRTTAQNSKIHALKKELEIGDDVWRKRLLAYFGKETSADLSVREAGELIDKLETSKARWGTAADKKAKKERRLEETTADLALSLQAQGIDVRDREPGEEG